MKLNVIHVAFFLGAVILGIPAEKSEADTPSYARWLAVGDSITQHGPDANLHWLGEPRGMAASSLDQDYVHLLQRLLQSKDTGAAQEVKIVGRLGKLGAGTVTQVDTVLADLSSWNADLVTIQLGENDRLAEVGPDGFERDYRSLVDALLGTAKRPVIVCTGVWSAGEQADPANPLRYIRGSEARIKDDIIEKICREKGLIFVPIAPIAAVPENHGDGEDPGVRWHPNDKGMLAYANAIFEALYPAGN